MSVPTVETLRQIIDECAPEITCEAFDNVGLLLGRRDAPVHRALVALDATESVVREAARKDCSLIVTHHPLLFHARKRLVEEDAEARVLCALIRRNIALIAAHTNLDKTDKSGSACAARLLGLQDIAMHGYLAIGTLREKTTARDFAARADAVLKTDTRVYGDGERTLATVAVAGGAFDEGYPEAMALGADALVTGEVRHHHAIAAVMDGFVLMDAGHFATEAPLVAPLARYLQNALDALQYSVQVIPSEYGAYADGGK